MVEEVDFGDFEAEEEFFSELFFGHAFGEAIDPEDGLGVVEEVDGFVVHAFMGGRW